MAPPTQSVIWRYFKSQSPDYAQCIICKKIYSRKGRTTTSLKNHLKSMHVEEYVLFLSADAEQKGEKEAKSNSEDNSESKWLASKKFEFSSEDNQRETLDTINDDRSQSNLEKRFDEPELSLNESERSLNQAEELYEEEAPFMEGPSRVQNFSEPLAKKKRTPYSTARPPTRYNMQTVPEVQTTHYGQEMNPFDLFGKYIAAELRQLSQRQAVLLQQELQNCITNFKLSILQPEPMHLVYNPNEKFSNHQPEVLIPSLNDD